MTFLDRLDDLMAEKNLSRSKLAKVSGVPYTTIDGFYKKGYENAKLSTIRKLATALDVSIDDLVVGKPQAEIDDLEVPDEILDSLEREEIERKSGRADARKDMIKTHGTKSATHFLDNLDDKVVFMYYKAFDNNMNAVAASRLVRRIEKSTPADAGFLTLLVESFVNANEDAQKIVQLALAPFLPQEYRMMGYSLKDKDSLIHPFGAADDLDAMF